MIYDDLCLLNASVGRGEVPDFSGSKLMSPITRLTSSNRRWLYMVLIRFMYPPKNEQLAPKNQWLEDDSCPFWGAQAILLRGQAVCFRRGMHVLFGAEESLALEVAIFANSSFVADG